MVAEIFLQYGEKLVQWGAEAGARGCGKRGGGAEGSVDLAGWRWGAALG